MLDAWERAEGLGRWRLGEADVQRFHAGVQMRVLTPGSSMGEPLHQPTHQAPDRERAKRWFFVRNVHTAPNWGSQTPAEFLPGVANTLARSSQVGQAHPANCRTASFQRALKKGPAASSQE